MTTSVQPSIQPVQTKDVVTVTVNIKDFIVDTLNTIKDKIVELAIVAFNYAKETAWPAVQSFAQQTWSFLRTPAGLGVVFVGLTLGLKKLLANYEKTTRADEQPWVKGALRVAIYATILGTGVAVGLGLAMGFSVKVI